MAVENNEVRILGIRPAHNTDDFPVSQADKDLLKMTIHLMAYHLPTTTWKKVFCDVNGKLIVDPTAILENPPVEDNASKAATSEWCYDHWKLANAHHAKYTDAEARASFSPISLDPACFIPYLDTYDWHMLNGILKNRVSLTEQHFTAPILFPNGVTVTKITLYGYRDDASATLVVEIRRQDRAATVSGLASLVSTWTDGYGSISTEAISNATVDNTAYSYFILLSINPNDSVEDVKFTGLEVAFTG